MVEAMEVKSEFCHSLREVCMKVWKGGVAGNDVEFFHNDVANAQRVSSSIHFIVAFTQVSFR